MANATAPVPMFTNAWGDSKIKRNVAATVQTYYPGGMVALDASGNVTKCTDATGISFAGINCEGGNVQVFTGDAAGDHAMVVDRPWRFMMAIAAAVAGDEGKALYAVDDQHVGYTSSHSVLVGWVDKVLDATHVLVNPLYAPLNPVAISNNTLAFAGTTGANQITMPDNLADALSIAEGSNEYVTFVTTDAGEKVLVKKLADVALGINFSGATTANVLTIPDNLADALNVKEGTNSYLKFVTTNSGEKIIPGKDIISLGGLISAAATGVGIGYGTGAGGTVVQITSRATGVTINKLTGTIQTDTSSLAAGAEAEFTVTNSTVAATDTVVVSLASGNTGVGTCQPFVSAVGAGSFKICISNLHASTAEVGACILNFAIFKGVAA